jgi:lipopolysaccharide export system permease protein
MKNISQLTHDIDSLNRRYLGKVDEYYRQYSNSLLYTVKNYSALDASDNSKSESSRRPVFNTKRLYDSLSVIDKKTVVSKAIENIKAGNSFLSTQSVSLHSDVQFIKRYEVNWHKKFTLSAACLVFFLIGAPLGAIIRKGGLGTPAVISVLFFVIWYVISLSGEKLVEENLVSAPAGVWASTYILLPIGIFLTYKASTDSVIMNIETYLSFLKRIKDTLYKWLITGTRRKRSAEEQ